MGIQPDRRLLQRDSLSRLARAKMALRRLFQHSRRSSESLRTTVAILKAQQEATLDGILVVDNEGKVLSCNRRFLEIWRVPPETRGADDDKLLQHARKYVANWTGFIAEVEYLYSHPREVRTGQTIPLNDGRILSRTSIPVITGENTIAGRAWYFRDITEEKRAEHLQAALFKIAQLTRESHNLDQFYAAIHRVINELMDATNFYIAEYDAQQNILTFPYFVDVHDPPPQGRPPGHGLTSYILRTGEPLFVDTAGVEALIARGEVDWIGTPSIDWLGVPLKTGERTWGMIGVQTYDASKRLTGRDKDVLVFVAQHVASAIEQKRQEDALRESERRYRQMFENNRAVKLLLDPVSGAIVDANMAACDFYGYSADELKSMRIWDINVLGADRVRSEMNVALARERSFFVFRHMRANGEVRDVEVHSGPVDIGGRRLLYSIIHDITERRRAEQALQQSEEKYRNIFKHAPVGILQSTREGRLITANTALAHILGYDSVDELLHVNASALWLDVHEREDMWEKYEPRGYVGNIEVQWKKKDGTTIWVQVNAHVVKREAGTSYVEAFVHDVTERKRAEELLTNASAQRKAVLEAATRVSIVATDPQGVITVFNSGAERMLGYSAQEMLGQRSLLDLHLPQEIRDHGRALSEEFKRPIAGFDVLVLRAALEDLEEREWTYVGQNGERKTVVVAVTALRSEQSEITGFLHVATDITERKQTEEMLRKQSAAIMASMDGIGILDERLQFTYLNDALARLYGYPKPQSMIGRSIREMYDEPELERFDRIILPAVQARGRWRGEATGRRRDGFTFPQEISLTATDGAGMVCVVRDVTERTYAEEQIKHLAYHDALTGLPNRLLFKDRLTVALSHAQRDRGRLAVLFLDLDRFKVINDSLGHNIGDQLLQAVATRVQSCVRDSDTVARLGGDEFTLLLPSLVRSEDAALVAQKIIESVRYPFHIEGREFFITTSIGISLYPEDGADAATLIKNADTAMYQAKEQGRDNYQLFNAFVNAKALQRIALEHGLRRALANQEMVLFYQPIFDLRSGRITGMEALLRWTHPDMGSVPPAVFIPLAEATGVMVPIGGWALRTACRQAKSWHDAGYRNLSLAVNLSVTQLQQADLVDRVKETLEDTGLKPEFLELEITESSAMQSPETSVRTLIELKKLGLRVSLDDFGTGHSSLSYLKRFPIDTLKIDQSFVRDINTDADTAAIVTAIIAMAHSLRMKVIAEGVEQAEQAAFLKRHACDQMQGFLVKPPVPASEFLELMRMLEL